MDEFILKMGSRQDYEWQEFRDKHLYTIEVNGLFEVNLDLLKKIYSSYYSPRKKFMNFEDALKLLMKDSLLNLSEKDATYCYGMSKMTVTKENDAKYSQQYSELKFLEFLEMIGRVAELKFHALN